MTRPDFCLHFLLLLLFIDAFIALKELTLNYKEPGDKLAEIESRYDKQFGDINEALKYLLQKDAIQTDQRKRKRIGFKKDENYQRITRV